MTTNGWTRHHSAIIIVALTLGGCAATPNKDRLSQAYKELDSPTPNYNEMIAAADEHLAAHPTGPGAAEASYLHGRALEERAQRDPSSPQKDFADAASWYNQALSQSPRPALEGLIHTGIGNVLYFQDRYPQAITELSAGYEKLERDTDKAWALYRIGLSNQRIGQWDEADKFFASVQQQYPQSIQAQRARDHQGARAFFVQVGAYTTPALADTAVADLRKQGLPAARFADPSGKSLQYVRVGPLQSYEAATATKQRVAGKYTNALILP